VAKLATSAGDASSPPVEPRCDRCAVSWTSPCKRCNCPRNSSTVAAALALAASTTFGGDTNASIWKWTLAGQNGDTLLKLKQDGEKLTGSYTNQFGKAEITDGSLKDGDITFKVKRELNGQAFLIKYSGKLSGDKITGKCEFDFNGETRALEWEAKRDTAKAAATSGN